MKKVCILFAFLMTGSLVHAQIDQGTIRAGGNLGFNTQKSEPADVTSSSFNFGPSLGYFVADGLEAILGFSINSSKTDNNGFESNTNGTSVNLGLRKYMMVEDNFGVFVGVGFGISNTTSETVNPGPPSVTSESKTSGMNAGLNAGITFWPVSHVGLTAGFGALGFSTSKVKDTNIKNTSINFGLMSSMNFGLSYYFH